MKKLAALWKKLRNKKLLTIIAAVLVVVILLVVLFIFKPFSSAKTIDAISIIPDNAAVILKTNKSHEIFSDSGKFPKELNQFSEYNAFCENYMHIDSILSGIPSGKDILQNSTLYISLHFSGNKSTNSLYIIDLNNVDTPEKIEEELSDNQSIKFEKKTFEKTDYYKFDNGKLFAFSYNNLIVASKDENLLHSSISCKKNPNKLSENNNFKKSTDIASETSDINIFIHLPFTYRMLEKSFAEDAYIKLGFLDHFAEWGNIDLSCDNNSLLISGALPNSNEKSFINIFDEGAHDSFPIHKHIPSNIIGCQSFSFNNFNSFFEKYIKYQSENGISFDSENEQELFDKDSGVKSLSEKILSNVEKSMTIFICPGTEKSETEEFCVVPINDPEQLISDLKEGAKTEEWDTLTYRDVPIFVTPCGFGTYSLFGPLFYDISGTIIAVTNSAMYISSELSSMKNMLNNVLSGRTLEKSKTYQQLQNGLSSTWHTFSYLNISSGTNLISEEWLTDTVLTEDLAKIKNENSQMCIAANCSREKEGIIISGSINFGEAEEESNSGWFTTLDAFIESGPKILHSKKQNKYWIIASDNYENIYLLNQSGKIEWKKKIDGVPNNDYTLMYENTAEKTAIMFSTKNSLYKIGINGEIDNKFPVKINDGILTKIQLCDYDNNQKYRIIFCDNNGKLHNYTGEGKETEGWKKPSIEIGDEANVLYRRLNDKDYFLILTSTNTAYLFNRRGEKIAKTDNVWFNKSCQSFFTDKENNCFLASNTDGSIISVNPDGSSNVKIVGSYSEDYIFTYTNNTFYIFDEGNLYAIDNSGNVTTDKKNVSQTSIKKIKLFSAIGNYFIGFVNHDEKFGIISCNSNFNMPESQNEISDLDIIGYNDEILLIKGCDKTISAEVLDIDTPKEK